MADDVGAQGVFDPEAVVKPEEGRILPVRDGSCRLAGPVAGLAQPGVVVGEGVQADLHREIGALAVGLHLGEQRLKAAFQMAVFRVGGEVVALEPGRAVPAEIPADELR